MGIQKEKLANQEIAETTGLSAHTRRCYTADDVGWIDFLLNLRATGMSIKDMQR